MLELANHLVDELDRELLDVDGYFLLTMSHTEVELIGLLVNGNQKQHALLILPVDPQQVRNQLPVAVNVHSEVLLLTLDQVVNFRARVFIGETVSEGEDVLELQFGLKVVM